MLLATGKPFLLPLGAPAKRTQILGKTPSLKINIYICGFLLFPRELCRAPPAAPLLSQFPRVQLHFPNLVGCSGIFLPHGMRLFLPVSPLYLSWHR